MKTLQQLIEKQLPMNRKERFFTGTVLPMIIAKDNFKYLHLLLRELNIEPIPEIIATPEYTNIQFFTEYSLVESLYRTDRKFKNLPETKDTPDLIIFIDELPKKILIAIEAKMYSSPNYEELEKQIDSQKKILNSIEQTLEIDAVYHVALLPEKFLKDIGQIKIPVITWERICELFQGVAKDDYFMTMLKVALQEYEKLASPKMTYGKNNECSMIGQNIYDEFQSNTLENQFMGREGGLNGEGLINDLRSGKWKTRQYETRKTSLPSNKNWFAVEDFVKKIKNIEK